MITEKDIKDAEKNIPQYLLDGLLSKDKNNSNLMIFYRDTAKMSFQVAQHLYQMSTDEELKKINGFNEDFECFLWVLVSSYYSMFYIANAALAKLGLKVGDKIPHKITQDALMVYFLSNKRLAKHLLEEYIETKKEVLNLMNMTEEELLKHFQIKAHELIANFGLQREKRGEFQYNIKTPTKQNVAQISLERAKNFIQEMNGVMEKIK